jgi:hypothetical protein
VQPLNHSTMRFFPFLIIFFISCNLSSLDTKKTGLHKVSQTSDESKANGVFRYKLLPNKNEISIGGNRLDTIQEAWIENAWEYQQIGREIVVQKDSFDQVAIRFAKLPDTNIGIWLKQGDTYLEWNGVACGTELDDSLFFVVNKDSTGHDTILDSFKLNNHASYNPSLPKTTSHLGSKDMTPCETKKCLFQKHFAILDASVKANPKDTVYACCMQSIYFMVENTKIEVSTDGTLLGRISFTKSDWIKWHEWYNKNY